ncbi:hypothetical protein [Mycolicibacter sinensis]
MLDPAIEQQIADMDDDQFAALVARTRPPTDPRQIAAQALRAHRAGTDFTPPSPAAPVAGSKAAAAQAMRDFRADDPHRPITLQAGNKSDRGPAMDAIANTGLPVSYDNTGASL